MTDQEKFKRQKELRRKAEELLKNKSVDDLRELEEAEVLKLLHELEVHQIELELINKELIEAKKESDKNLAKFTEFFDFAPISYFVLSEDLMIQEINITGTILLNSTKESVLNTLFTNFCSPNCEDVLNTFFEELNQSNVSNFCNLRVLKEDKEDIDILCYGVKQSNSNQFLIALVDRTKQMIAEKELQNHQEHLEELVKQRTKELEEKNAELLYYNELFVGREFRIRELKDKIIELEEKLLKK